VVNGVDRYQLQNSEDTMIGHVLLYAYVLMCGSIVTADVWLLSSLSTNHRSTHATLHEV
jgi:hypothetical protein